MRVIDRTMLKKIDKLSIILILCLFCIGIISIASIMASPFSGTENSMGEFMEKLNLEYVKRQLINFFVGFAGFLIIIVIDYHVFIKFTNILYIGIVTLLLILVVIGKTSRGVAGWFLFSNINRAIQPAELCKVVLIIAFAKLIGESATNSGTGKLTGTVSIAKVLGICALPTLLVCLQPDFGTAFVFICIFVACLFVSGISWKIIVPTIFAAIIIAPLVYFFLLSDDQQDRIRVFLDPELDPLGAGYNVIQSKLSIGSGQMSGKGFFTAGTLAQLKYVPERHTDFIFSGIVEAIGFVGGTTIILLFFALIFRWLYVAYKSEDVEGTCICVGSAAMILAHVFENIGMTMGLMPVTGIPLPFISYGGSNLLTSMAAAGLVINVSMRRNYGRNPSDRLDRMGRRVHTSVRPSRARSRLR